MSDELVSRQKTVIELDGFDDFTSQTEGEDDSRASARVIQGTKLKFIDPRWLRETADITGLLLTVVGERNVVNLWGHDDNPIETRILAPGEKWPDFKKLNDACDRSMWREKFGKLTGPWSGQHVLYFVDENWNRFTWPSPITTIGSSICVNNLMDDIKIARKFRGANVYAVAELSHANFNTGFGLRQRPALIVKRWVTFGPDRGVGALPAPDAPMLNSSQSSPAPQGTPAGAQPVAPVILSQEMACSRGNQ
jgi:hypothetical protein